ncbi:Ankyrin repeat-containing protein [Spatholobus suberectus]|nr:Ankyrin repeat-containing protein [Spatholobus suberectus]
MTACMDIHFKLQSEASTLVDMSSADRLNAAAEEGDTGRLYELIKEDPYVLEHIEAIPFVETPLHVAASAGKVPFAYEIMCLKPSFARKLNHEGFNPIHLALESGHKGIVLFLVNIDKDLVRAKGREGLTPLHYVILKGENDILEKFLKICPDSINDVTVRNETALHIAVKDQNMEALNFLVKWLTLEKSLDLVETIMNWEDEAGNTVLHIAASKNDEKAMTLLMTQWMVFDAKNLMGQTALDIVEHKDIKRKLARVGAIVRIIAKIKSIFLFKKEWIIVKFGPRQHMSEEVRNAYLVVATLVATATYQAALSPPGGFHQTDVGTNNTLSHVASKSWITWYDARSGSKSSLSNEDFIQITMANMFCFFASTFAIVSLMPRNNVVAWLLLTSSMLLLQASYMSSIFAMSPTANTTKVVTGVSVVLEAIGCVWYLIVLLITFFITMLFV